MRNTFFSAVTLIVLGVTAFSASASSEEFFDLIAEADALAAYGDGLRYDNEVGKFAAATFGSAMKRCLVSTPSPSSTRFDVVAVLAASGKVEKLMVQPKTNLSTCISPENESASFPKPPSADYPVHLDWSFN